MGNCMSGVCRAKSENGYKVLRLSAIRTTLHNPGMR